MVINWKAFAALLVSVGALVSHPEFTGVLPEKWALLLTILGIVGQALTQQVARSQTTRARD